VSLPDWPIKNEQGEVEYRILVSAEEPQNDGKVKSGGPDGAPIPCCKKVRQMAQEAEQKSQEAEARSATMIQTMSMLSHDLRSPLQGIMGVTSLALHEFEDHSYDEICFSMDGRTLDNSDTMYEYIYTIHSSSQLLLNFINNMMEIRKIQSGMMETLELECFDLGSCVDESAEYLAPLTRINGVTLNVWMRRTFGTKSSLVMGTPLRVQQVLVNLIGNAVKYSSHSAGDEDNLSRFVDVQVRRSTVQVARREAAGALCSTLDPSSSNPDPSPLDLINGLRSAVIVDVRDRGDGIPVEEADNIFAEFKQLQKHTGQSSGFAQPTGSGLGLQLFGSIMAGMKGCLWANNCDDNRSLAASSGFGTRGCVFSFYLECPSDSEARDFLGEKVEEHNIITQLIQYNETKTKKEGAAGSINKRSSHNPMKRRSLLTPLQQETLLAPARLGALRALVVDDILINVKVLCRMLNVLGIVHVRSACNPVQALEVSEH
jgi:signal transduction histidine kinase